MSKFKWFLIEMVVFVPSYTAVIHGVKGNWFLPGCIGLGVWAALNYHEGRWVERNHPQ